MSTVGQLLTQGRQNQKLTLSQAAEITKIRSDYLQALEEGKFDGFPAPVYVRGFTRTYANLLKLDVPQVMAALESELGQIRKFAETGSITGQPRGPLDFITLQLSKVDWRKVTPIVGVAVLLGVVILIVMAWRKHQAADPLRGLKPGMYQTPSNQSGQTLPLPPRSAGH